MEGGRKETTKDKTNPSQMKETKENLEEASKMESQIPMRSEEVDLNLSSILDSMEEHKEGEPMSHDSNTSPISREPPITVNIILEQLSTSTPEQLARLDAFFDKCKEEEESP